VDLIGGGQPQQLVVTGPAPELVGRHSTAPPAS
jgi:hypothetical protein